jgi:hypothetical protein
MILHVVAAYIAAARRIFSGEILKILLRLDTDVAPTMKCRTVGEEYDAGASSENDLPGCPLLK